MEWDTSIGDWVPHGRSKAAPWISRRHGGPRRRGPEELLGGKRGGIMPKYKRKSYYHGRQR